MAALVKNATKIQGKHAIAIICGGNVSGEILDKAYDIVRGVSPSSDSSNQKRGEAAAF